MGIELLYAESIEPEDITTLDAYVNESSGLLKLDGHLWTHNDSGGSPELYEINPLDGTIIRTVSILNAQNIDWEDITYSKSYVYIGDFGNNSGNRENLVIYRIDRKNLSSGVNTILSEKISFYYNDQMAFPDKDFDCEAMIYYKDKLHLFSKNWDDKKTRHYILEPSIGNKIALYQNTFNIGSLVTAASINPKTNILVLDTYGDTLEPSNWLFYGYPNMDFFRGEVKQLSWSNPSASQIEGVTYDSLYHFLVDSEEYRTSILGIPIVLPSKLYGIDISSYITTYDDIEGALEIEHTAGIVWDDTVTSTLGMSSDKNEGSCWNHTPLRNVWIKFKATSNVVTLSVRSGENLGTAKQLSIALFESNYMNEISCSTYIDAEDDLYIHREDLIVSQWYYLSIDSEEAGNFTLYMDNHRLSLNKLLLYKGSIRLNSDIEKFEYFDGYEWKMMH